MSRRVADRVVVVTGASHGIGRAIARRLADEGARLVLSAGPADGALLERVAGECGGAAFLAGDLADAAVPAALVGLAVARFGALHGLVSCAMAERQGAVGEIDRQGWDMTLSVSLTAPMLLAQAALPHLIAGAGAIVHIGSQRAFAAGHAAAAYEAAKAGLVALTRSLAIDYGPQGVRCNCLSPGFVLSERAQAWLESGPRRAEAMASAIPLRRPGWPDEIAAVAAFLLSAEASYINGAVIPVDGGALAGLPENAALRLVEPPP